jgi:nucleotide-binding universal stress UspA family protein
MPAASVSIEGGLPIQSLSEVLHAEQSKDLKEAAAAYATQMDVSAELLEGNPADALEAHSRDLDLLVLGSRGYGPLRAVLAGSVSLALMRSAETPIVITPRGTEISK